MARTPPLLSLTLMLMLAGSASAATLDLVFKRADGSPVADAVVTLQGPPGSSSAVLKANMDQRGQRFAPHVLAVHTGTQVRFPNSDNIRHQVYSFSAAKRFELRLYEGTPAEPLLFDKPGVVVLGCNIHDQMVGWILVVDTPYYAQTLAATGKAQIDDVPAGSYRLRTWHTRLPVGAPALEQALIVPATGTAEVTVRMQGLQP